MYTKFMAFFVASVALSGCCVSGNGCVAPAPGAPVAWDGLGKSPTGSAEPGEVKRPRRPTARHRQIIVGPINDTQPQPRTEAKARNDEWTRLPNEDTEADAKLARKLKICRNC